MKQQSEQSAETFWYGMRAVYHFGTKDDGTQVFEERVVVFRAASAEEAHERAVIEADHYCEATDMERHAEMIGYRQDGDDLIDGYEVWSCLFEARLTLNEFYERRYADYDYEPDP